MSSVKLIAPGYKQVDRGDDVWADHDSNCHGSPCAFEDDPDMQDGFEWECCEQRGDAPGCIVTRHTYVQNTKRFNVAADY